MYILNFLQDYPCFLQYILVATNLTLQCYPYKFYVLMYILTTTNKEIFDE